jgi:hypothetical protein
MKLNERDHLGIIGVDGDNIKMILEETEREDLGLTYMSQYRVQWQVL